MKTLITAFTALGLLALGVGTASAGSPAYCDNYARNYANQYANPAANTVGGAVSGAIGGAILGGIFGGSHGVGTGAAIGAGVGALGGAANSSPRWQQLYNDAYYQCLGPQAQPQPTYNGGGYTSGSPEWYQYCAAKYKSFNPDDGTYLGYDGYRHPCQ